MCLTRFEWFALENQDGLHVCFDVLRCLKLVGALELLHTQLKHVKHVAVVGASEHKVVRSLLLVTAHCEKAAIVLNRLVLN